MATLALPRSRRPGPPDTDVDAAPLPPALIAIDTLLEVSTVISFERVAFAQDALLGIALTLEHTEACAGDPAVRAALAEALGFVLRHETLVPTRDLVDRVLELRIAVSSRLANRTITP